MNLKINLKINRQIKNQFLSSLIGLFAVTSCVLAAPQDGVVVGGSGSINSNINTTTVNQNSQSLVVNWSSFNVNANESVNFVQPSSTAAVLNQIYDQSPSQILGSINANGRVFSVILMA
jgi:large exoprotein involved in heme utilization and adhesion